MERERQNVNNHYLVYNRSLSNLGNDLMLHNPDTELNFTSSNNTNNSTEPSAARRNRSNSDSMDVPPSLEDNRAIEEFEEMGYDDHFELSNDGTTGNTNQVFVKPVTPRSRSSSVTHQPPPQPQQPSPNNENDSQDSSTMKDASGRRIQSAPAAKGKPEVKVSI